LGSIWPAVREPLPSAFFGGAAGAFSLPPVVLPSSFFQMDVSFVAAGSFAEAVFFLSIGTYACVSFGGRQPLRFGGTALSVACSGSFCSGVGGLVFTGPLTGGCSGWVGQTRSCAKGHKKVKQSTPETSCQ